MRRLKICFSRLLIFSVFDIFFKSHLQFYLFSGMLQSRAGFHKRQHRSGSRYSDRRSLFSVGRHLPGVLLSQQHQQGRVRTGRLGTAFAQAATTVLSGNENTRVASDNSERTQFQHGSTKLILIEASAHFALFRDFNRRLCCIN